PAGGQHRYGVSRASGTLHGAWNLKRSLTVPKTGFAVQPESMSVFIVKASVCPSPPPVVASVDSGHGALSSPGHLSRRFSAIAARNVPPRIDVERHQISIHACAVSYQVRCSKAAGLYERSLRMAVRAAS